MIWLLIVFVWLPITLVLMYLQLTEDQPDEEPQQEPQQKSYRQIVEEVRQMFD
jgi:hypothetical protein